MGERIRTFIAIELPEEVRRGLARVQGELKRSHPPVRWVSPEKIHVTLKFLGEIPAEQVETVCRVVAQVATSAAPFELEAAGAGVFPNLRRPRVIWVGVQGDLPALHALQASLERELARAGFPEEERPFSPHLTLGRVQDRATPAEARSLGQTVAGLEVPSLGRWRVEQVVVMRSDLRPEGPIYTPLRVLRLGSV